MPSPRELADIVHQMRGGAGFSENSGVELVNTDLSGEAVYDTPDQVIAALEAKMGGGGGGAPLRFEPPAPRTLPIPRPRAGIIQSVDAAQYYGGQHLVGPGGEPLPPTNAAAVGHTMGYGPAPAAPPVPNQDVVYFSQRIAIVDSHTIPLTEDETNKLRAVVGKALRRYLNERLSPYVPKRKRRVAKPARSKSVPVVRGTGAQK